MNLTVHAIYKESVQKLCSIYEEEEASSIANILFEDCLGIIRIDRLTHPTQPFTPEHFKKYEEAMDRLLKHEPVQHIAGFSYFLGRKFNVSKETLIPRTETEELVALITNDLKEHPARSILDVGTGTGCIAISLALGLRKSVVEAWDISSSALAVARENAKLLKANVQFRKVDVLKNPPGQRFDVIVSNPPYIPEHEKASMEANVLNYEPGEALFVPDGDPLLFYREISEYGRENLTKYGCLYFEIHEDHGIEIKQLLHSMGYQEVRTVQDLHGKDRMIRARKH